MYNDGFYPFNESVCYSILPFQAEIQAYLEKRNVTVNGANAAKPIFNFDEATGIPRKDDQFINLHYFVVNPGGLVLQD